MPQISFLKNNRSHDAGFTMFEILVAVTLITLIAGFAIPQYDLAIRKNREQAVINQLQAMRSAALVYRARNGGFWDTNDLEEDDLMTINGTLGTTIFDPSGLITYSYTYETVDTNDTFAVRADWTEGGTRSVIEIRESGSRVSEGPCCNVNVGLGDPCATLPAQLPNCT